jgi:hypothetical protein
MKAMRRIFDVLGRDRQLAAANIVRSCPHDWKQGDGVALHDAPIKNTIKTTTLAADLSRLLEQARPIVVVVGQVIDRGRNFASCRTF